MTLLQKKNLFPSVMLCLPRNNLDIVPRLQCCNELPCQLQPLRNLRHYSTQRCEVLALIIIIDRSTSNFQRRHEPGSFSILACRIRLTCTFLPRKILEFKTTILVTNEPPLPTLLCRNEYRRRESYSRANSTTAIEIWVRASQKRKNDRFNFQYQKWNKFQILHYISINFTLKITKYYNIPSEKEHYYEHNKGKPTNSRN